MNLSLSSRSWILSLITVFLLASCAASREEVVDNAPIAAPVEQEFVEDPVVVIEDETLGAEASGVTLLDGTDSTALDTAAAIEAVPLSAMEMLQQSDGALANRTIYFAFDSAQLTDESLAVLEEHGNFLAANPDVIVRLEGHTDERGSREYNIALGDRRAQSVRRVMLFQGSSLNQVDTVSYGEEQPIASGHNEESWAQNRRVELIYKVN